VPRCCFNTQKATPSLPSAINSGSVAPVSISASTERWQPVWSLKDKYHRPKTPVIRPEAKAWGGRFYWFLPPVWFSPD
jgi:hypothetical protein